MDALFSTGLVSVTFRQLSVDDVIKTAVDANLTCIEWGGDIHVPHGNTKAAEIVAKKSSDYGLSISCYGSYYRLGQSEKDGLPFERVLDSALALKAPIIRIWAGTLPSDSADPRYRAMIEMEALRVVDLSQKVGCRIAFEYHSNTLTDTCASSLKLLKSLNSMAMILWQPRVNSSIDENGADLQNLLPWLSNVHVFHQCGSHRHALAEGMAAWSKYLKILHAGGEKRDILLEFVRNDSPAALRQDADTLHRMLKNCSPQDAQNLEHTRPAFVV